MQGECAKIKYGGDFDKNVSEQNQGGISGSRCAAETTLQKFRHRVETVAQIKRKEDPEQRIEADNDCAPFDGNGHKAAFVSHAHRADQMMAADVRCNDAAANHPPRKFITGEKVIALGALAFA